MRTVESGAFSLSVLERGSLDVAGAFGTRSGKSVDKLAGVRCQPGRDGAPVLEESVAYFDCRVISRHPAGDHEVVIGRVVGGAVVKPDAQPMAYGETGNLDASEGLYPDTMSGEAEEQKAG